jgi:hypothetical protein
MKTQVSLRLSSFSGGSVFFILKERKSTKMNTPPTFNKRNIGDVITQRERYNKTKRKGDSSKQE